jgi:hypothetical protein
MFKSAEKLLDGMDKHYDCHPIQNIAVYISPVDE